MKIKGIALLLVLVLLLSSHTFVYADGPSLGSDMSEWASFYNIPVDTYLLMNLLMRQPEIPLSGYKLMYSEFEAIFKELLLTNPELYTVCLYKDVVSIAGRVISFTPTYIDAGLSDEEFYEEKMRIQEAIKMLTDYASQYEEGIPQIIALHNKICKDYEYGQKDGLDCSGYSLLRYGIGTCQAYVSVFGAVLHNLGYEVTYVECHTDMSHIWNAVKVDGEWYHIDICWDDIGKLSDTDDYRYKYFMLSDEAMSESHGDPSNWVKYTDFEATDNSYSIGDYKDGTGWKEYDQYINGYLAIHEDVEYNPTTQMVWMYVES